ncbi:MAG: hypothetical protein MRY78_19395, partial [Saprospiraceae bacterium]|nr:hypothetical protein [Saprospiraceae bacterium]
MKNVLFTILLFSISLIGYSQPTLTIDSQSPVIGTSFEAAVVSENFDSLIVDIGTSGPDQFWDFSQYTDFNTGQFTFIEATEAPCLDSFPDANFALAISQNAADTLFVYYGIQEDTIARLGTVSGCGTDSELINYFSQPEKYYQLPATFGSSYNFSSTNQTIFNG